jgi:hypothetical protein
MFSRRGPPETPSNEQLEQEVRCLLCDRLILRLVFPVTAASTTGEAMVRVARASKLAELRNLRCATCGGTAVLGAVERTWSRR